MTRKYLRERQARKIAEGQQDAANRCAFCKRDLWTGFVVRHKDGVRFCDVECLADDAERTALIEARR